MQINKIDIAVIVIISIVFKVLIASITTGVFHSFIDMFDLNVYATYAANISHGLSPYVDFNVEYPPLFIIPVYLAMMVANFFQNVDTFFVSFKIMMILFDSITVVCVYLIASKFYKRNKSLICSVIYSLSLPCAYFTVTKYDAFPVMLLMISIVLFLYKQDLSCYLISIAGFFTKWFPIISLPYFIISNLKHSSNKKETLSSFIIPTVCCAAIFIFFLSYNPDGFLYPFITQSTRNPNVVSFPYFINLITSTTFFSSISFYITILLELLILAVFYSIKKPSYYQTLGFILISMIVFVLFNNVFSPQFIMWFSPLLIIFLSKSVIDIIHYVALQIIMYIEFPLSYGTLYTNISVNGLLPYGIFITKFLLIISILYILLKRVDFFEYITNTTERLAPPPVQK